MHIQIQNIGLYFFFYNPIIKQTFADVNYIHHLKTINTKAKIRNLFFKCKNKVKSTIQTAVSI
ncbi:hypothetical protein AY601_4482 [Pedobacter cryoconitis]|uniref:Uncharacterized protein n=1 Tax=Pedobacter cryoconitis TaxID=188932 RepID=A0A127VJ77_9SPHI|nr:hypothetical protein AY601_4482 [Pedobacter cryoconitis]